MGDGRIEYRPQESPANHYIHGGAGDAGGILLALLGESSSSDRSLDLQPGAHKFVLNVAVVEEWVLHAKNLKVGRPTAGTDNSPEGCRRTPFRGMMG